MTPREKLRAVRKKMNFPYNTDGASRHLRCTAEWLLSAKGTYTVQDPENWASSMIATLEHLYDARAMLEKLTGDPFARSPEKIAGQYALVNAAPGAGAPRLCRTPNQPEADERSPKRIIKRLA